MLFRSYAAPVSYTRTYIRRWHSIDKLAESYFGDSPYCYAGNNPTNAIDIAGLTQRSIFDKQDDLENNPGFQPEVWKMIQTGWSSTPEGEDRTYSGEELQGMVNEKSQDKQTTFSFYLPYFKIWNSGAFGPNAIKHFLAWRQYSITLQAPQNKQKWDGFNPENGTWTFQPGQYPVSVARILMEDYGIGNQYCNEYRFATILAGFNGHLSNRDNIPIGTVWRIPGGENGFIRVVSEEIAIVTTTQYRYMDADGNVRIVYESAPEFSDISNQKYIYVPKNYVYQNITSIQKLTGSYFSGSNEIMKVSTQCLVKFGYTPTYQEPNIIPPLNEWILLGFKLITPFVEYKKTY